MMRIIKGGLFGRLKLSRKFLLIYIFCVILPLVMTDAILFRSIFDAERISQNHYRESAIEGYANYLDGILAYDSKVASAIDINKNLNTFLNTWYSMPYDYYDNYVVNFSNSFFTTLSDINRDRIVIYTDNPTIINGNYFHKISEAEGEVWYKAFTNDNVAS